MLIKVANTFKRWILYALILAALLPVSFLSANHVQASEGSSAKNAPVKKASSVVAKPVDTLAPVIKGLDNLKRIPYTQGQSIIVHFSAEKELKAWAIIGGLDGGFPQTVAVNYIGDGYMEFRTPTLGSGVQPGEHRIELYFKDRAGNLTVKYVPVFLRKLAAPEIIYVKKNADNLYPAWTLVKNAKSYVVEYKRENDSVFAEKRISNSQSSTKIAGLESGTAYQVKVTAIYNSGQKSVSEVESVKTLGIKPEVKVAEISAVPSSEPKVIPPAIGGGVSTGPRIAQEPTQQPSGQISSPAPTPTPAASEEPVKGGWNRLLIALSILIIAAAVAVGGYYGYEWALAKNKGSNPTDTRDRW